MLSSSSTSSSSCAASELGIPSVTLLFPPGQWESSFQLKELKFSLWRKRPRMRNKASLFNQGLWNLENKERSGGRCITTTSAFDSLVYTTTWANPGLRAWAPWSLWSPRWERRGFISESLPWGTAGWGSRICLSMSVCLCVSLSLSFLLRELKAKAVSGKLDISDTIQNSVPIKCLKYGVKKEDSGFELWHWGG